MTARENTFEGGTNGTTLTVSNSGGASGDPFDQVSRAGGATTVFDNAQAAHGTLSCRVQCPTATDTAFLIYSGANDTSAAIRAYVRFNTMPGAAVYLMQLRNATGGAASFGTSASNKFTVLDSSGAVLNTFATVLTAGTWYRIELECTPGTTTSNGTISARYFLLDAAEGSPQDTAYTSSVVNAGITNLTNGRYGKLLTTGTIDAWYDNLKFNNGTNVPIGPASIPTAAFTSTPAGLQVSFDGSSSTAISPATISSYAWTYGDTGTGTGATPTHTYAAAGTYSVQLTVTDSNSQTNSITHSVTVSAPTSNGTLVSITASAGWTPSSGTVLSCLTDADPTTFVTSSGNPTALELDGVFSALTAPATNQPAIVVLAVDSQAATTATVNAQLFEGATQRSALTGVAISAGSGGSVTNTVSLTFPWSDVQNVTNWNAIKLLMQFTAS